MKPAQVESRTGAGTDAEAPPRFPSPLIKPDVPISGIRLSDWLHRRLTHARLLAPGAGRPPTSHTPRSNENWRVPCEDTLCRLLKKFRTRSYTYSSTALYAGLCSHS